MGNKRGFEFSFGWIFALIVGAAIIFLAVYAAIKFIGSEQMVQETEAAKQLEAILTPIETGYEEGKATHINFPAVTRVYNNCSTEGNFGKQSIRISTLFGNKWPEQGLPIVSYNKYIFSPDMMQGKEIYAFSKPFKMPFKVANLLFLWNEKYCFVNPIPEIEQEISDLNLRNLNITDDTANCDDKSKKVCFDGSYGCDVVVYPEQKYVSKNGQTLYYEDSLIYGAIFSEPDVYECQVKRLMKRTSELALLYNAKSALVAVKSDGCSSNLQGDLETLGLISRQLNNSAGLREISNLALSLGEKESMITNCKIWGE